jgi:hypothetical protein
MYGRFVYIAPQSPKKYIPSPPDVADLRHSTALVVAAPSDARAPALGKPRKIPWRARRLVIKGIASAIAHCTVTRIHLEIHAESTLVSAAGDVRLILAPAPDARYSSPESFFGFPQCTTWSAACLLVKLITGAPLISSNQKAASLSIRIVGTIRPRATPFESMFEAFDATKWHSRAPRLRIPHGATGFERAVLARALTWNRHEIPFGSTRSLATISEEEA